MSTLSSKRKVFDAVVVGSGAAGGWAAKELTESGMQVLLLEAGPPLDLEEVSRQPYPTEEPPSPGLLFRRLLFQLGAALQGQHIQARCNAFSRATRHLFVDDRRNPYATPKEKPFYWFRGRQLGGRLHTWTRLALRMSDYEFKAASRDGHGIDWPITYEELAPYYDKVETFLGLSGSPDGVPNLPDGIYASPTHVTAIERVFAEAVKKRFVDLHVVPVRRIADDPYNKLLPLLAAGRTGRLVLRTDAVVHSVSVDPNTGKARGVVFVDARTGQHEEAYAKVVVLCASSIESVRILLNSSDQYPHGLGNASGLLGRYFMDHLMTSARGEVGEEWLRDYSLEERSSSVGLYIPSFRNVKEQDPRFSRGYGMYWGLGANGPGWTSQAIGEMMPRRENRITLDAKKNDAYGVPVARIECAHCPNDEAMIADMRAMQKEIAEACGLKVAAPRSAPARLLRRKARTKAGAFIPGASIHELGGARMGSDPSNSILNSYNQCWEVKNLFVTDGACFVSGGFQNPTLTIMALTVRACQYIVDEFKRGNL